MTKPPSHGSKMAINIKASQPFNDSCMNFKNILSSAFTLLIISVTSLPAQINKQELKVEPLHWYTDMPGNRLQLIVYGDNIGHFRATQPTYEGVTIKKQIAVDSPNYLFLYLGLSADVKPGKFPIILKHGKKERSFEYEIKEKTNSPGRNQGFDSSDVIYLLMPDRFANGNPDNDTIEGMLEAANRNDPSGRHGGDIEGIEQHLDYIKDIGMTAVWLTPVFENDQTPDYKAYHGYAATDLYKIDRRLGSNEEFVSFVETCHKKGLKVIMDMIHNHVGNQHWWMKDLPTKDWIHDWNEFGQTNFRGEIQSDPYAAAYDLTKLQKGWFVREMPDLNQRNELLADYLIQNTLWWIEYSGVDGVRMDTYVYPYKDYMARWAKTIMETYPSINIVGESWVETVAHEAYWQQDKAGEYDGYNSYLPSVTDFQIYFALKEVFNEPFDWNSGIMRLYYVLSRDRLYADPMKNVIFLDNHDVERFYSTVNENKAYFKMAYAYLMTTRGIPQVYYGTELMFRRGDVEGDGSKRADMPGGWEEDERSVFTAAGRTTGENEALDYVSKITNWRKGSKAIHQGKLLHFVPENNVYVYFRHTAEETVMVVMNLHKKAATISRKKHIEMLRGFTKAFNIVTGQTISINEDFIVPGETTSIFELKR